MILFHYWIFWDRVCVPRKLLLRLFRFNEVDLLNLILLGLGADKTKLFSKSRERPQNISSVSLLGEICVSLKFLIAAGFSTIF